MLRRLWGQPKKAPVVDVEQKQQKKLDKWDVLFYSFLAMLVPEAAFAAPWDNMLNYIIGVLNGGTARLIAILVIIGAGFAAWRGKLDMGKAAGVIGGIVLVFGAAAIGDLFIGAI